MMIIEESIMIHAPLKRAWQTFTDITRWKDWNTILRNVSPGKTEILTEGGKVRFCIYPFTFPVYFEPNIEEVVPIKKVVWASGVYGIFARHEFAFEEVHERTLLTSREVFRGLPVRALSFLFPESRLRRLTVAFLKELKKAAERR